MEKKKFFLERTRYEQVFDRKVEKLEASGLRSNAADTNEEAMQEAMQQFFAAGGDKSEMPFSMRRDMDLL